MPRNLAALLALTTTYAVLRYAGFGGVSPLHIPAFLVNKAISMSAVVALALAAQGLVRGRLHAYSSWSRASAHLVFVHVLLSLGLMSRGNYPAYYEADRMSLTGEGALVLGVLAAYGYWRAGRARGWPPRRVAVLLASALVAGHLLVMGYRNWIQPARWNGGLPPITLLSFGAVVFAMVRLLRVNALERASDRWTTSDAATRARAGAGPSRAPRHEGAPVAATRDEDEQVARV
jgi:hypothetical protein